MINLDFDRKKNNLKSGLDHLPQQKQDELEAVTSIIRKVVKVEMVWLFGSYATGKWVEEASYENGVRLEYRSDYDILVILPFDDVKKHYKIKNEIKNKLEQKGLLETTVSLIFHSLKDVNLALINGSYFFVDIIKEGILLANNSKHQLAEPKLLTAQEKQQKAQEHFGQWFESANMFLKDFHYNFNECDQGKHYLLKAAFELHQAVERYFHTTLLVFTDFKPKQHDIELLEKEVIRQDERFAGIFPKTTAKEQYCFELLKRAYIDSRYKMDKFNIEKEELEYLSGRVIELQKLTKEICEERINSFITNE